LLNALLYKLVCLAPIFQVSVEIIHQLKLFIADVRSVASALRLDVQIVQPDINYRPNNFVPL
jgi:membrane-anchored glycerophosphoryl diester phosphodiesterase (GDPDase)